MEATVPKSVIEIRGGCAPSDEVLLSRVAAGDDGALAELYDRHGRIAFGLAFRILRDRTLAEDAVQEAFLSVWRSAAGFRPDRGTARAWLLSLVHRRAVDLVRREERRRSEQQPDAGSPASVSAEDATVLLYERRRVADALHRLPVSLRRLLELAYYGGLTQSEIAARLDIPLGTVKSRTFAALDRLRELLADDTGDPIVVERASAGA